MGADWLQLFDKKLCDEIFRLRMNTLSGFIERHATADRVRHLLDEGETESSLKRRLVDELCFGRKKIHLDYWGCYVEVFAGVDPPGAIADYTIFPELQEQGFLLLLPDHVDRMVESLELHRAELTVTTEADLILVRQWRDFCAKAGSHMVAYVFDV